MNITIYAKPVFKFTLTRDILNALIYLSQQHYDWKCKSASAKVMDSVNSINGFLTIWQFHFPFVEGQAECDAEEGEITGVTWGELDTVLKICENRGSWLDDNLNKKLGKFVKEIYKAMDLSNKTAMGWTITSVAEFEL
jgi:hypothetical protein